jgi:hypothetical protein
MSYIMWIYKCLFVFHVAVIAGGESKNDVRHPQVNFSHLLFVLYYVNI